MVKKGERIKSHKDAAQAARDLMTLREAMRATKAQEARTVKAIKAWMSEQGEAVIEQEGFETLEFKEQVAGYEWNCVDMPDEGLQTLRELNLLTVRKGEYDAAVLKHGPLGLLNKWAYPRYTTQLRFKPAAIKHKKEVWHGNKGRRPDRGGDQPAEGGGADVDD